MMPETTTTHVLRERFEQEVPDPYEGQKDRHTIEQRNKSFQKWIEETDPIEQYAWQSKEAEDRYYGELQYYTKKQGKQWISIAIKGLVWHHFEESKKPTPIKPVRSSDGTSLFEVAKQELLISDIATRRYGLRLKQQGNRHILKCPFHEDRNPSCVIFDETNTFYCSSNNCGEKGDLITFIRLMEARKK